MSTTCCSTIDDGNAECRWRRQLSSTGLSRSCTVIKLSTQFIATTPSGVHTVDSSLTVFKARSTAISPDLTAISALLKRQVRATTAGWNSQPRSSLWSDSSKLHQIQTGWSSSLSTLLAYHRISCTSLVCERVGLRPWTPWSKQWGCRHTMGRTLSSLTKTSQRLAARSRGARILQHAIHWHSAIPLTQPQTVNRSNTHDCMS